MKLIVGENDLATLYPKLANEWDYEKNELTPQEVSSCSVKKVWWKCSLGHSYETSINHRVFRGDGCPYCSGKRVLEGYNDLATTHKELCKEWNFERNAITPKEVSKGSSMKVWWKCNLGHNYVACIYSRIRGNGCPYCSGKKVLQGYNDLVTTNFDLSLEWDYERNKNLTPYDVSKGSNKLVWWKCNLGHEYQARISSRSSSFYGCPYCSGRRVLRGFNDLITVNKGIANEWNYEKNILNPFEVTESCGKKVWWKCHLGHAYESIIANKTKKGYGCPYCSGQRLLQGYNDLATTHKELCKEWDYEKNELTPQEVSKGSDIKAWWVCSNNHSYKASINHRATRGDGCPYCSGSKMERFLYDYLKREGILFQREKKFKDLYISYYPYDVYCKKENVIIEADGLQHFESIDFFNETISFKERVRRDNLKNTYCLNNNIAILRIPYIYDVVKDKDKIENLVLKFIQTNEVPQEIIDYYEKYDFSNYSKLAKEMNERFAYEN